MLHIIDKNNRADLKDIVGEARRLRHRVFVQEMGWEALRRDNGEERDQFDTDEAVEAIFTLEGVVAGYSRLLPTTAPHLLTDVLPELCEGEPPRSPAIWEWTRLAVDPAHRTGPIGNAISFHLAVGLVRWGLANGVTGFVMEVEPIHLLRFITCHFMVQPLGLPHRIGSSEVVAALCSFDQRTLAKLVELQDERVGYYLSEGRA